MKFINLVVAFQFGFIITLACECASLKATFNKAINKQTQFNSLIMQTESAYNEHFASIDGQLSALENEPDLELKPQ